MRDLIRGILLAMVIAAVTIWMIRFQTCVALCEIPAEPHGPLGAEERAHACAQKFGGNIVIWRTEGVKHGDRN